MDKKTINKIAKYFFLLSFFFYLYTIFLFIIGSYEVDIFDGSLRILSKIYIVRGLTPYRDFSVVYPPGIFLVFGKIFPYLSIIQNNIIQSLFYILLTTSILLMLGFRNRKTVGLYCQLAIVILFISAVIRIFESSEAFSLLLLLLNVLLLLNYIKRQSIKPLFFAFAVTFASVWFRWDWMLFLHGLYFLIFISFRLTTKKNAFVLVTLFRYIRLSLLAYLLSLSLLLFYLQKLNVLKIAIDFICVIPVFLTTSYRDLPLPIPKHPLRPEILIYLCIVIYVYLLIRSSKKIAISSLGNQHLSKLLSSVILLSYPLVFVLYAIGRSDWLHAVPLWFAVSIIWVLLNKSLNLFSQTKLFIILLTFLPLAAWYVKVSYILVPRYNFARYQIDLQTSDCRRLTNNVPGKSIFVGRLSYDKFLWNNASLYLVRSDLKPASSFITEEPGIHNSCKYGKIIAGELQVSQKPMLAVLAKKPQEPENKKTREMKSCGQIERYLQSNDFTKIGSCQSLGEDYEVRLYN